MNKSESKYFNTAARMDEAFLALLAEKSVEYITVKEICHRAGVNRSTYYLHYETINDLLVEAAEYVGAKFAGYFEHLGMTAEFLEEGEPIELISPEFLRPWLAFIRDNKVLYRTVVAKSDVLQMGRGIEKGTLRALNTALERRGVPEARRPYVAAFFLEGMNAVAEEWLKHDCAEDIDDVVAIIIGCVRPS